MTEDLEKEVRAMWGERADKVLELDLEDIRALVKLRKDLDRLMMLMLVPRIMVDKEVEP